MWSLQSRCTGGAAFASVSGKDNTASQQPPPPPRKRPSPPPAAVARPPAVAAAPHGEWTVSESQHRLRLDRFLHSASRVSDNGLLHAARLGAVTLNGRKLTTLRDQYVKQGDSVVLLPHAPPAAAVAAAAAAVDWRARVLYEDTLLLVVDKPAGLASTPARSEPASALSSCEAFLRLRDGSAAPPQLFPLHRLDKDTSGVLMLAKAAHICDTVSAALRSRKVRKVYEAILQGSLEGGESGLWSDLLEVGNDGKAHVNDVESGVGKSAKTEWRVTERFAGVATAVELSPLTGRMHQLRAQAASRGAPVLGDERYGRAAKGVPRLCLHCKRMSMAHPLEPHRELIFEAPTPPELAVYAQRLRKRAATETTELPAWPATATRTA